VELNHQGVAEHDESQAGGRGEDEAAARHACRGLEGDAAHHQRRRPHQPQTQHGDVAGHQRRPQCEQERHEIVQSVERREGEREPRQQQTLFGR
jgi:hypothetical protein